jgi:HAD superfamily hydrolase (TIGR01459 family)
MIPGISALAERYDYFILDIYGVIHDGVKLFPDSINTLTRLKGAGKQTCLLSNTPRLSEETVQDLEKMGLPRDLYTHVLTGGQSAREHLGRMEGSCWFLADEKFRSLTKDLPLALVYEPEEADFVLNAISGTTPLPVNGINDILDRALKRELPMICANPDLVVDIGEKRHKCAGTYAQYYEDHGGKVTWHGKPHEPVYETARKFFGNPPKEKIVAIGDSLRTDIQGANRFGIDGILNLAGLHREEAGLDHANGAVDISKLKQLLEGQPYRPAGTIAGFDWQEKRS